MHDELSRVTILAVGVWNLLPHLVAVLNALWNNGQARELRPTEIADITHIKGAYGNHSKLSYKPWNLVVTVNNRRALNEHGIAFMQGKLRIPRDIIFDSQKNDYVEKPGTEFVGIDSFGA